jgi:hypothetical protein
MIEELRADRCQITAADRTAVPRLRTAAEAEALTAGRCPLTVVGAAAAELRHPAVAGLVAEADLRAVDSAEAEATLRPRATAQAVEAGLLLTAVVTRTAVTNLIL